MEKMSEHDIETSVDEIRFKAEIAKAQALSNSDAGSHYRFKYTRKLTPKELQEARITINLDPFRIAKIYHMDDFSLMTILKKCLCTGNRGYKDFRQDLLDIINAAQRRIEMLDEDEN
jgi:hypothetical protein